VKILLSQLAGQANRLILDLAPLLDQGTKTALRLAHRVALVSEPDSIALQMTRDWLGALDALGAGGSQTNLVVVNRGQAATALTKSKIEELLGVELRAMIIPAPEMCLYANQHGIPVLLQERETPVEAQIRSLAQSLIHWPSLDCTGA
jgi:Flp pilus assembly CpaE family ATPase